MCDELQLAGRHAQPHGIWNLFFKITRAATAAALWHRYSILIFNYESPSRWTGLNCSRIQCDQAKTMTTWPTLFGSFRSDPRPATSIWLCHVSYWLTIYKYYILQTSSVRLMHTLYTYCLFSLWHLRGSRCWNRLILPVQPIIVLTRS